MATRKIVAEARYILASVNNNNNKFWNILRYEDGAVESQWGRVGVKATVSKLAPPSSHTSGAEALFDQKCREKEKKGYKALQVVYESGAASARSTGAAGAAGGITVDLVARDILGTGDDDDDGGDGGDGDAAGAAAATVAAGAAAVTSALGAATAGALAVATAGAVVTAGAPATLPVPARKGTATTTTSGGSGSSSTRALERLVKLLVRQNVHEIKAATGGAMTYSSSDGLFRTPLGIVTDAAIADARKLLDKMAPLVAGSQWSDPAWNGHLSDYLTLIPRDIGRHRPTPSGLFPNPTALQKEHDLLDSLAGSLQMLEARRAQAAAAAAASATGGADGGATGKKVRPPKLFDVQLKQVAVGEEEDPAAPSTEHSILNEVRQAAPTTGEIFRNIRALYERTTKADHSSYGLKLHRVYRLQIGPMAQAYEATGKGLGNVMRLWHGTRVGNILSIFKGGIVVPPSTSPHVTGRLFGDGIYGSSTSTKALNYCLGAAPGQSRTSAFFNKPTGDGGGSSDDEADAGDSYFAFLADFAMGRVHEPTTWGAGGLPYAGSDSTWAKPQKTGLRNDEMIVYKAAQVNPRWLCEFKFEDASRARRYR